MPPYLNVLAAVDVDLGAVDVGRGIRAQHVDDLGNLVRRAEPVHRNILDDLFRTRRQHRGVDLAGRDRIDADAERAEVGGHLAGQRCQRRLRGAIGRAGEWMHVRAGDRGDIDHRALGRFQLVKQTARQHDRRKEVDLKDVMPVLARGLDRRQPFAARGLGRDRRIVDESVQFAVQPVFGFDDRRLGIGRIGEVDLNVILRSRFPRTVFRKRMPRAGDDAPAGGGKALYRCVADAAAGSGQKERAARLVAGRHLLSARDYG